VAPMSRHIEPSYWLRVAGGDSVPVRVDSVHREQVESFGVRFSNQLANMVSVELLALAPIPEFQPPFRFGQAVNPKRAQLAMFHGRVDGPDELGRIVDGRVVPIDWTYGDRLVLLWLPDDEMSALPW
jgi:hypothetical protein